VKTERRFFVAGSTAVGAALFLTGCRRTAGEEGATPKNGEEEVSATEDLMREHGVIRRAFMVYREAAHRLQSQPGSVSPDMVRKTAMLLRSFGEDYHERKLEEEHLFPMLKRAASPASSYVDVLTAQHQRGREITDYILAATRGPILASSAPILADTLDSFARMYEAHTAREETIVFPAWKKTLSPKQYDEIGEQFEDIERATFGSDGFLDAVRQIGTIEASLGLDGLEPFTAPPPPKVT
jgi:hemerythrin-like domain-containing protein